MWHINLHIKTICFIVHTFESFVFTGLGVELGVEVDVDFELPISFLSVEKSAFRIGLE